MIKQICLLLVLTQASGLVGMQEPYEPDFAAKHPYIMRALKTSGAGLIAGATAYALFKKRVISAGAITAAAVYFYDKFKKPNFLDSVLCNPEAVTEYLDRYRSKLDKEGDVLKTIDGIDERLNVYKNLVIKYQKEAQTPLLRIGECSDKHCPLTRSNNNAYRRTFEDKASQALLEKLEIKNDVVYTGFGTGGKFQDLVILTKVLAKKPDARIAIHLIDVRSQAYANYCGLLSGCQVKTDQAFSFKPVSAHLLKQAKEQNEEALEEYVQRDDPFGESIESRRAIVEPIRKKGIDEKEIQMLTFLEDLDHKEFLSWLTSNFPRATISLHTHGSAEGYLKAIDKYRLPLPDVLTAADIQDDTGATYRAFEKYSLLCSYMHEKKTSCVNILLALDGDWQNQNGVIFSINKEQVAEDDEAFTFKEKATSKEKKLFIHKTKIN